MVVAINNKRHIHDTGNPSWSECVTGFGGMLRKLWERAVEEVLSPVLTRWTHDIHTPGFIKLTVLTDAHHTTMREAYKRCSILEHYQPAAGNTPQPTADDLAAEATQLAAWFTEIQTKQKAVG